MQNCRSIYWLNEFLWIVVTNIFLSFVFSFIYLISANMSLLLSTPVLMACLLCPYYRRLGKLSFFFLNASVDSWNIITGQFSGCTRNIEKQSFLLGWCWIRCSVWHPGSVAEEMVGRDVWRPGDTLLCYLGENSFTDYVTVNFQFYFLSDFHFLVFNAMKFKFINCLVLEH